LTGNRCQQNDDGLIANGYFFIVLLCFDQGWDQQQSEHKKKYQYPPAITKLSFRI